MTEIECWNEFKSKNKIIEDKYDSWSFGVDADELASLVVQGEKKATSSAYPLYEIENEELPQVNEYSIILNSKDEAVCIIKTTKVYIIPFNEVSDTHAYLEGEGDKSLRYWRKVHEEVFSEWLKEAKLEFTFDMKVVCEEFEVVYKK